MSDRDAETLEIRKALPVEEERAAELIYGTPSPESVGIAGGAARAVALGAGLFRVGAGRTPDDDLLLAFVGRRAVGALLGRPSGGSFPTSPTGLLRTLPVVLRLYRLWELPGLARRARLRARLDFPVPPGSYHVVELHVEPASRGAGIGSALLRRAETLARERGCARINLTTSLTNPALRLYAREGYAVLASRTAPGYEEIAGTPGRAFLEKSL
jgi:ribosomal protein S18 acetylase RimI-like enzyme